MKASLIINLRFVFVLILVTLSTGIMQAQDTKRIQDLRGDWKFKTGDKTAWSDPKFDDSKWDEIYTPSAWENEGYPGYDGFGWYRLHFDVPKEWLSKDIILDLGRIDDADETYINGQLVGFKGGMPPNYFSQYGASRQYPIQQGILHEGKNNVIAVRVFDDHGEGGIIDGKIGFYERINAFKPDIALPATWKFIPGDNMKWKEVDFNDNDWAKVRVPSFWESQGFKDYDGYAWYRVKFKISKEYEDKDLILLAGRIDDFDEVYLNGKRIGRTGTMPKYEMTYANSNDYAKEREYVIPSDLLRFDRDNVIAVRVYDCWSNGGIWDGPIGIITREHYRKYKHTSRHYNNWFNDVVEDVFDN